jgi:shingomyelin synthase
MFFILGLLYLMRAVTMYVTVLPVASYTYYCSPKMNTTTFVGVMKAALKISSGFGLSINGQHTYCGDYMYSGHTVILVTAYLVIQECKLSNCIFNEIKPIRLINFSPFTKMFWSSNLTDSPRRSWRWILVHWFYWIMALVGIVLVLVSRGHYTIDVLVAYYVTTRLFWIYHSLANNNFLKVMKQQKSLLILRCTTQIIINFRKFILGTQSENKFLSEGLVVSDFPLDGRKY